MWLKCFPKRHKPAQKYAHILSRNTHKKHSFPVISTAYISFIVIVSLETYKTLLHPPPLSVIRSEAACESMCVLASLAELPTVFGSVVSCCLAKLEIGMNSFSLFHFEITVSYFTPSAPTGLSPNSHMINCWGISHRPLPFMLREV